MNNKAAAVFIQIQNRLISLTNIIATVLNADRGELKVTFLGGEKLKLTAPEEIDSFLAQVDAYVLPPVAPLKIAAETAAESAPESEGDPPDNPESDDGEQGEGEPQGDGETETEDEQESDEEPSALEQAGLPSDLASLLHAGGLNTVEDVLTHPDLTEIDDIGKGRKEKILEILQK